MYFLAHFATIFDKTNAFIVIESHVFHHFIFVSTFTSNVPISFGAYSHRHIRAQPRTSNILYIHSTYGIIICSSLECLHMESVAQLNGQLIKFYSVFGKGPAVPHIYFSCSLLFVFTWFIHNFNSNTFPVPARLLEPL